MSNNPLSSTIEHVEELESEVQRSVAELNKIPYSKVRRNLAIAVENYEKGLFAIKSILGELVERGKAVVALPASRKRNLTLHEVLRKHWSIPITRCYNTAENFRASFDLESQGGIPWELYHLLIDIFDQFGFSEPFVFREADQFVNETSKETIVDVLDPLIKPLQEPIPSTIVSKSASKATVPDVIPANTISYIAGEARNPLLWPVLVHEGFHVLDKRLGLFDQMEKSLVHPHRLPNLDKAKGPDINRRWSREIFQDIAAAHYFGPLYSFSLLKYFERLPYLQTIEHPEMSVRLYSVNKYLEEQPAATVSGSDILTRALGFCRPILKEEISKYVTAGELTDDTTRELDMFYEGVTSWIRSKKITLFEARLNQYLVESDRAREMVQMTTIDKVPYVDPAFKFEEVVDMVCNLGVYPAFHPTLLLNIVLSASDSYTPQGFQERYVDCMRKWCVKEAWNQAISPPRKP